MRDHKCAKWPQLSQKQRLDCNLFDLVFCTVYSQSGHTSTCEPSAIVATVEVEQHRACNKDQKLTVMCDSFYTKISLFQIGLTIFECFFETLSTFFTALDDIQKH